MYCCDNTNEFRLILSTKDGFYGIIIPCQSGQVESEPKLVMLKVYRLFTWDMTYFGYNSAVTICEAKFPLMMVHYSWPEGSSESPRGPSNSLVSKLDKET